MKWLVRAARAGYAAKGLTYVLMALLALQAATSASSAASTSGALGALTTAQSGGLLLLLIGLGLASYALWKLYLAIADPERRGWNMRATALVVAFTNGGFAVEAVNLALATTPSGSDTDAAVHWSRLVIAHPVGRIAIIIIGVCFVLYGLTELWRASRRAFDRHIRHMIMAAHTKRWLMAVCKFGIAARGVVFGLVGWFLVRAAVAADASEARDFGHSLNELRQQPLGRTLLCVVAFGLFAYAIYQFLRARYQRFAV